ncbi:beta-lactamase-like protein [Xylaria bambusicola]|uniref:beta-lactamase-like protein n=1 Tax=Xylaria bambusicola TaxID=326684 RepID=UPI00200884B2|nr:beta-lactamase-like protein [Xylaria bambusicola]KAI0516786.1 beta-lactamase-like protein [Xylaria bambusicola]
MYTMAAPVDLNIPPSTSIVNVSIIDTGATFAGLPASSLLEPNIPGHEWLGGPCFAFLVQHPSKHRSLLFDLAMKKDWKNWPKQFLEFLLGTGATPVVPTDVRTVLDKHGVDTTNIEGVIWSHTHFDHIGDVSTLEQGTKIIVGPGTKKAVFPGYPTNPAAHFNESDVAGHEVQELDFENSSLKIGGLTAIDYFEDGSFYLLDAPGHCVGHISALARVTSNPDSFILLGGDAVHHGGELRPHHWHPLPDSISPNPFDVASPAPCPGEIFHKLLLDGKEAPFYEPSRKSWSYHLDVPTMLETIKKLQEIDAHENVFIIAAHDAGIQKTVDLFPKTANSFMEKGWVQKTRWAWLADFAKAVGQDENIPREIFGDFRPISTGKE